MIKFRRRIPPMLTALVLVVVATAALWLLLQSRAAAIERQIQDDTQRLKDMTSVVENLPVLESDVRDADRLLDRVMKRCLDVPADQPPESQETLARAQLNEIFTRLASKAGTSPGRSDSPSVKKPEKESTFRFVVYHTTMPCDEKQLSDILLGLANHEKLLPVTELRIISNWRNPKVPQLSVDITVGGYYRPSAEGG